MKLWHVVVAFIVCAAFGGVACWYAIGAAERRGRIAAEAKYQAELAKHRASVAVDNSEELDRKAAELRKSIEALDLEIAKNKNWLDAAKKVRRYGKNIAELRAGYSRLGY